MYYQLLGPPMTSSPSSYRGVYRSGPAYQEALPETAPVNLVWQQYVSKHGEKVAEEETALELARRFAEAGQSLDLVRIEQVSDSAPVSGEEGQLGFDVASHGWYSLLSWGLTWANSPQVAPHAKPLLALVEAYFRPRLNAHGLFSRWEDARFFLDVAKALAALAPGFWEAPGQEQFEVVRLTLVPSPQEMRPSGSAAALAR